MQTHTVLRRLPLAGAHNTRELGGYPCHGGTTTNWRVFLRSDSTFGMTEADISYLQAYGITTAIDLRGDAERASHPSSLENRTGFTAHHVCLSDQMHATNFEGDLPGSMSGLYISLLDDSAAALSQVFSHLAEAQGGSLFHCSVGKDRTGVVALLLLKLAGVADIDVVADYSMSEIYMQDIFVDYAKRDDIPPHVLRSKPQSAQRVLQHLAETYGTAEEYMLHAGVSPAHIQALRRKLVHSTATP